MRETPSNLLSKILRKCRQVGFLPTLRMISARVFGRIPWLIFRLKNPKIPPIDDPGEGPGKEERICRFLTKFKGGSFLEIGIGAAPSLKRFQHMISSSIDYTGCDFEQVCQYHKAILESEGLLKNHIHFLGNTTGTYARTLFDMLCEGRRFSMVYLDGAHTFYIDLPAFYLAHALLEPGGYFLVDDINWTLSSLKRNMWREFEQWLFYHRIYNFNEYTPEQQNEKAIKLLAEEVLIKQHGYELRRDDSLDGWWVLQKPAS